MCVIVLMFHFEFVGFGVSFVVSVIVFFFLLEGVCVFVSGVGEGGVFVGCVVWEFVVCLFFVG